MKITFYASTNEVLSELGRRIKAARIALPATQKEMAEMTNLSQKTISNLETGKDVSFSTVVEVLRALGLLQSLELMIPEQGPRPSDNPAGNGGMRNDSCRGQTVGNENRYGRL